MRASVESLRNYVRDNALCLTVSDASSSAPHYDARCLKISRVAWPTNADDATSKSYVERSLSDVKADEADYRTNISSLTMRLENSADHSAKRIIALYKKFDAFERAADERTRALKTDVSQIRAKENALEDRLQTLENLQALAATKIEVAEAERFASRTRAAADKRLSDLENSIETNRASKDALNELLHDLETSVTRIKEIDERIEKRVHALERSLSQMSDVATKSERNRAALSDHDRTLQELTAKAQTSNAKLRELDAEVSRLRKDANELARKTVATTAVIPKTSESNTVVIKLDGKIPNKQSKRG